MDSLVNPKAVKQLVHSNSIYSFATFIMQYKRENTFPFGDSFKLSLFIVLIVMINTIAAKQMMWISGSNEKNQLGNYGSKGVPDSNNIPGARYRAVSWIDSSNNLYLFGGYGYATSIATGIWILIDCFFYHYRILK